MRKSTRHRQAPTAALAHVAALSENAQRYHDGAVDHAAFSARNRAIWEAVEASDARDAVLEQLRSTAVVCSRCGLVAEEDGSDVRMAWGERSGRPICPSCAEECPERCPSCGGTEYELWGYGCNDPECRH